MLRVSMVLAGVLALAPPAAAGVVHGKLELPPAPDRPPIAAKGFLDRVENPLAPVKGVNVAPLLVVVLEGEAAKEAPGQITWDLAGESFSRPVLAVPVGTEVVLRNSSKLSRSLAAAEDPKLIQGGPLNPTGTRSIRPAAPGIFTIGDKDAPHLQGKLVVVPAAHVAYVEPGGKFELEVPEGTYKVRVFYKDNWIQKSDDTVTVPPPRGRAKSEVTATIKIPAGFPLAGAPAKK